MVLLVAIISCASRPASLVRVCLGVEGCKPSGVLNEVVSAHWLLDLIDPWADLEAVDSKGCLPSDDTTPVSAPQDTVPTLLSYDDGWGRYWSCKCVCVRWKECCSLCVSQLCRCYRADLQAYHGIAPRGYCCLRAAVPLRTLLPRLPYELACPVSSTHQLPSIFLLVPSVYQTLMRVDPVGWSSCLACCMYMSTWHCFHCVAWAWCSFSACCSPSVDVCAQDVAGCLCVASL
jgi:hypothetical protein